MLTLDYSEFYITNVCNLACDNCNRFNNFAFAGHQRWNDYKDIYAQWAKRIDLKTIGILGGEPMLNPDFLHWVNGVAQLWPHSEIRIITNGTQFKKWPDLYATLQQYRNRISISVSVHKSDWKLTVVNDIVDFYPAPVDIKTRYNKETWKISYNNVRDSSWPSCDNPQDFYRLPEHVQKECIDIHKIHPEDETVNGKIFSDGSVTVLLNMSNTFNNSTVIHDPTSNQLRLNNSDPAKAIEICYSKKCHHFIRGKLYKCGPVGVLPEFVQQFPVTMSTHQKALIESYTPADVDWNSDQLGQFVDDLKNTVPIAQCSLCPEKFIASPIHHPIKKYKIEKIPVVTQS